ncbi:MAG: lipoprotein [Deltaproteobacteria bacterium]|nr:lipoprotein [Deltaproteobacteria bacterium]
MTRKARVILFIGMLVFLSSCLYDNDIAYLNDQVVALNRRVKSLEDALDTRVRSGQVTLRTDIDEVQDQVRQLNGRIEENERLLKRAVERDLGDQDAMRTSVGTMSERVATLESTVEQHHRYLNLPPAQPKPGQGAEAPPAVKPVTPPAAAVEPKNKETELYDKSIALFRDGKYEETVEGFRTFLKTFPKSDRAGDAHFWIGESYMALKQYEQAILAYQEVIKNYPKGNKVPSALLRQAFAFLDIKDQTSAKLLLNRVVKNYPSSSEAKIAQKKLETLK